MLVKCVLCFYFFSCCTLVAALPERTGGDAAHTFTVHFKPVDGTQSIDLKIDKQPNMTWFDLLVGVAYALKIDCKVEVPIECFAIYGHHLTCRQASVLYTGYEEQLMKCVPHRMGIINVTTTEYNNDVVRKKIAAAFNKQFGVLKE